MRPLPAGCLEFLTAHEGEVLTAYHDPVGYPTQGVGRLLSKDAWADLSQYPPISHETSQAWLAEDATKAMQAVLRLVKVPLNDNQLAALISFAFNLGAGALEGSTLLRLLNGGDYEAAANQFPRWVYAGGKKLPGLVRRRAEERDLFLKGD